MKSSKYYIRVMRPVFQRAIFTIEASSDEAARQAALEQAERLSESDWALLETEQEPAVVEIALPEEETEGGTDVVEFLNDVQHAYALLQADLDAGEGDFIAPTWLKGQPGLMISDLTQDWMDMLSGIHEEGVEEFMAWLGRQGHPANVVDFFAERDKRRGKPGEDPDQVG